MTKMSFPYLTIAVIAMTGVNGAIVHGPGGITARQASCSNSRSVSTSDVVPVNEAAGPIPQVDYYNGVPSKLNFTRSVKAYIVLISDMHLF